jgi:hypothetical protein
VPGPDGKRPGSGGERPGSGGGRPGSAGSSPPATEKATEDRHKLEALDGGMTRYFGDELPRLVRGCWLQRRLLRVLISFQIEPGTQAHPIWVSGCRTPNGRTVSGLNL